jgi:glycosyltransferase involved in cell wall biosynthesis
MDQHPMSLGGVQTSVRLQRKFLERAGLKVTVFAPKSANALPDDDTVILPSRRLSPDGEYSAVWDMEEAYVVAEAVFEKQKFDLIHLQGDFAAAAVSLALAKKHNIPLIHHAHTNIDVVLERIIGKRLNARLFNFAAKKYCAVSGQPKQAANDGWEYMAITYPHADLVLAPSSHFAKTIEEHGISKNVTVMLNGVDDDSVAGLKRQTEVPNKPVQFIWAGRFLREKRLLQTIRAFKKANLDAELVIYGTGALEKPAKSLVRTLRIGHKVSFNGRVDREQMLQAFADADIVLQTSIGFETQGMTVFEAAAFGTPALCCDKRVAGELKPGHWWVTADESIEALAQSMRESHAEVLSGNGRRDETGDKSWLLQSKLTERMIEIYKEQIRLKSASS